MSQLIDHLARLTRLRDVDELDAALCALLHQLLPCKHAAIHRAVTDGSRRRWLTTAQVGAGAPAALPPTPVGGELPTLDARPAWRDCLAQGLPQPCPGTPFVTLHPMLTDSEALGVLEVHTAGPPDAEQARTTASLLGFYRHLRGLIDENERDSLTGLLNRKTFDEAFVRAAMLMDGGPEPAGTLAEQDRRDAELPPRHWLAVIDIDHFKRVNDQHGHLIGDEVLLLVAQLMRANFRHGDRIYRFGGEEFVVLLRCPGNAAAGRVFDRLRQRIELHDFPQLGRLTVSIGHTGIEADDTPGAAFERADQAVYHAKQTGRNRTVAFTDLAPQPATDTAPRGELEFF